MVKYNMSKSENLKDAKARKDFLKSAAETLLEMKKQLHKEMQVRVKGETEGVKDEGRDTYDLASDERDREINFILNDREREKLHAIDEALERIETTGYGKCVHCGEALPEKRLDAVPWARHCVRCQDLQERGLLGEDDD